MSDTPGQPGRPSKYKPEYNRTVHGMALLGATDEEMAKFLGVTVSTFNLWKHDKPGFSEALKAGREDADAKVAASLYERACGYSHREEKIFNNNGEALVVETTKHYPPDTGAAIIWLKNRQRHRWRDRQVLEGDPDNPVQVEIIKRVVTSAADAED